MTEQHFQLISTQIKDFKEEAIARLNKIDGKIDEHNGRIQDVEIVQAKTTGEFRLRDQSIEQLARDVPKARRVIHFWGSILTLIVAAGAALKFIIG